MPVWWVLCAMNSSKPTCSFITLGCKVNQYDTQAMREELLKAGYEEVPRGRSADVYVVNTCTVTGAADAKSARAIRRLLRDHPYSRVVVAGCGVDAEAPYLAEFAGRVLTADNARKLRLADLINGRPAAACETWSRGITAFGGHTRAFVKIQDGCDNACSYCIVPSVRGRSRVRPPGEVIDEIRRLADAGYLEIVLTGIHLGRHPDLPGIVREASDIGCLPRLRLSSIEALEVTDDLLDAIASSRSACPHLHLALQSGSEAVLRRMNRPYTAEQFLAAIERVRSRLPGPAISTDIIVGFPGETDEDFAATVEMCRRIGFGRIHVFRYSDRPGTAAAAMPDKCGTHIAIPRVERMQRLAAELASDYHEQFVGRDVEVLVESRRSGKTNRLSGVTPRYVRVILDGPDAIMGRIVTARITSAAADHVEGTYLDAELA